MANNYTVECVTNNQFRDYSNPPRLLNMLLHESTFSVSGGVAAPIRLHMMLAEH
jgi:hypothetical protein